MADHGYDTDLVLWAEDQARALRGAASAGSNLAVDWENVAEEIEALGKSQSRELASRISTVLVHLLKLELSPATEPRAAWRETIREQRYGIERVLADAPSLRRTIAGVIGEELAGAKERVREALADYSEQPRLDIAQVVFTEDQVAGRWFPATPPG
jgi:hypothetical protein